MSSRSTSEGIVFFPSRLPISWLDTDLPVTFCTDALLAAMLNTRALRGDRVWAALHHHCHSRRGPLIPEGINGYTLPPEVDAASYAEIIRRAIDSEEHYERLTMNVYEEFRQRLTGTLSAGSSSNLLEERVLRQSERRSPVGSSPALS